MTERWIGGEWGTEEYQLSKKFNFETIKNFLDFSPAKILDIGCGLAWESRLLNKHYGSELWLVDGDASNNAEKSNDATETNYHTDTKSFLYYHTLDLLDTKLKDLGTKNYHLIDCKNLDSIPSDIKFDLITSYLSCGFHYPVSTYKDFFLAHSHKNTKIIVDIRTNLKTKEPFLEAGVEIVNVLHQHKKHMLAQIRFL